MTRIVTDTKPNLSGFRLYLRDNEDYPLDNGEYESCTTLYRQGDGWYELSDDESVYTEPVPEEPVVLTPEELAEQERLTQVAELQSQIEILKKQLASADYKVIKIYEYALVGADTEYDIDALHSERQAIREQINGLEEQMEVLQEV